MKETKTQQIKRLRDTLKEILGLTKDQTGMPMNNIYFAAKTALMDQSLIHQQGGKYLQEVVK